MHPLTLFLSRSPRFLTAMRTPQAFVALLMSGLLGGSILMMLLVLAQTLPQPAIAEVAQSAGPSILHPSRPSNPEYRYPLDAVDPTAETYPRGVGFPGFRGEQQLIIYTPAYGSSTATNNAGLEAVVQNGVITQVRENGNTAIPTDGFVISGHGAAANWLARFARTGAVVALESKIENGPPSQLMIRMTPQVFRNQVADALTQAQSRPPVNAARYQQLMQEAQSCQVKVLNDANPNATPELISTANHCMDLANMAYYNTFAAKPGEFRGAWLRPLNSDPESVRRVIASLKAVHINQVFLETYFQGKTAYPSAVMDEYGLQQHPQYRGGDPVKVWIDEAHQAGIKVNLWVQVFFAGNQKENAEIYGPILTKYPQWRNIQRMNLNAAAPMPSQIEPGHFFVDPANPEVRTYLQKLIMEMVSKYDADGLNLDYIRYPASAAANRGTFLESSWGYTPSAREQFKNLIDQERKAAKLAAEAEALKNAPKDKNGNPIHVAAKKSVVVPSADPADFTPTSPLWPRWVAWRKSNVTSFVKDISEKAHTVKPNMLISAVVFPSLNPVYAVKLQDYPLWAKEGYIQALTPIGLSSTPDLLQSQANGLRAQVQDKVPIYVGIFGMYNRNRPIDLIRQIDAAHQAGMPGVVMFDWSRLNPDYDTALKEGPFRE
jgi:uncharacterized lipoprotein YddW (UPF0748 family)